MAIASPTGPPPELRFRRRLVVGRSLRDVARSWELIRVLAERDLRARYKQAMLGIAWAVLTPLLLTLVFTVFFSRVAKVNTGGVPYPLFTYLGLLPWTFFSGSLSQGGLCLLNNVSLLNKVYCPREVFPIASVVVASVDMAVALPTLGVLLAIEAYAPKWTSVWVPVLLLVQVAFTLAVTMVTSVIVVYLRDVRHILPIVLQLGLFATPVAYGIQVVPRSLWWLYSALNPLAPVIDGYRRTVLLGQAPRLSLLAIGAASSAVWLFGGYLLFKRLETGIADVA